MSRTRIIPHNHGFEDLQEINLVRIYRSIHELWALDNLDCAQLRGYLSTSCQKSDYFKIAYTLVNGMYMDTFAPCLQQV